MFRFLVVRSVFMGVGFCLATNAFSELFCIVCGNVTRGDHAVVWEGSAYPVHSFSCKSRWESALSSDSLVGIPTPIAVGHEAFGPSPSGRPDDRETMSPPGLMVFWVGFWVFVATISGSLGALFAWMLQRSPIAGFGMGFLVPAVGMVLVPILPTREKISNNGTAVNHNL